MYVHMYVCINVCEMCIRTFSIPQVEVYPIRLELGVHPLQEGKTITRTFSRVDKMSEWLTFNVDIVSHGFEHL